MLKKLIQLQTDITPKHDKLAHFFWGFIYAIISFLIGYYLLESKMFTMFIPLLLGGIKELRDSRGHGTPEIMDFVYTVIPSVVIFLISIL